MTIAYPVVVRISTAASEPASAPFSFNERRAAQVNEAVLPWLEEQTTKRSEQPFFLWVHYFDPHQPFVPPSPYDQLYSHDPYEGEIAYTDAALGRLLDRLRQYEVLDRTLVVMTADHGEGRGEHNEITHAILAYNSTLHVPLIIRPTDWKTPRVVREAVGTVDIVPTILDLLGLPGGDGVQGRSLTPLFADEPPWIVLRDGARSMRRICRRACPTIGESCGSYTSTTRSTFTALDPNSTI